MYKKTASMQISPIALWPDLSVFISRSLLTNCFCSQSKPVRFAVLVLDPRGQFAKSKFWNAKCAEPEQLEDLIARESKMKNTLTVRQCDFHLHFSLTLRKVYQTGYCFPIRWCLLFYWLSKRFLYLGLGVGLGLRLGSGVVLGLGLGLALGLGEGWVLHISTQIYLN